MENFWTKFYDPATAAHIPALTDQSLIEFFDDRLTAFASREFTSNMERAISYKEVDNVARLVSRWLQSQSLGPNASVAIMLPNVQAYLPVMIGAIRSGYVLTPINPLHTARELEFQLIDANTEVIFILENFAHTLQKIIDKTPVKKVVIIRLGDLLGLKGKIVDIAVKYVKNMVAPYQIDQKYQPLRLGQVMKTAKSMPYQQPSKSLDDVAFIQYTGGTTGRPKGILLTHRNILTAVEQYYQWFLPVLNQQKNVEQVFHSILALPLYHIFAFIFSMLGMKSGMRMTLVTNPKDIASFIKILSAKPFHILPGVNTLFQALVNHPDFKSVDTRQLKLSIAGGMAATPATAKAWLELTGCPLIEGWGMSETIGAGTCNPLTNHEYTGDIGLPLPSIDMKICDDVGNEVSLGEVGEICIKGDNVTIGYHNIDNTDYFLPEGHLKTGDIGMMMQNGHIKLMDRKKDMLIVSGFNVYPTEIEAVLLNHPKVQECAVIGVEDALQGQSVKAYIVKSDDSLTIDELKAFSHEQLTGYKRPRQYTFIEQLPKTAVGKIQKTELRLLEKNSK